MNEKKESFHYRYSAEQQKEVREIRDKYIPKEDSKMEQLRKLDADATRPGMIVSLILGIAGTLLLGVGMCCTMVWSEYRTGMFPAGVLLGVIGLATVAMAYPVYTRITRRQRKKLAPEILKLTDELMK